jgi:rfaE bifunctional protein nucleotidyltransferase chain/domain
MHYFLCAEDFHSACPNTQELVFTNGCFDLLHVGHVRYLKAARELGQHLVVGLNSDESVTRLKGKGRPIHSQHERAEVLLALEAVDAVILFQEDTPLSLIQTVRPHFLVKGGDYKKEEIVGADFVEQNGGEVVIIPFIDGYSTTGVLDQLKK